MKHEQRMMDEKIVAEMDQKVLDQQNTLEKAGVPGFYITTIPQVQITHLCIILYCYSSLPINFYALHVSLTGSDNTDELTGVDPKVTTKRVSIRNAA